jgi:hypothetical protein
MKRIERRGVSKARVYFRSMPRPAFTDGLEGMGRNKSKGNGVAARVGIIA